MTADIVADTAAGIDPAAIGEAVARRLRDLTALLHRMDSFLPEPSPSIWDDEPQSAEGEVDAARDAVLRMLTAAARPSGAALLRILSGGDLTTSALAARLGRPRLTVWEDVNDLLHVGLASHLAESDRVGLTAGGQAMAHLIEQLVAATREAAQ